MPSPISMHMPKIAMKSNTRLATMLLSKNLPRLLCFSVPPFNWEGITLEFELACFGESMPMFKFLQSKEYKANVPPAINE